EYPEMVYGMFVKSPLINGAPKSVDTTEALKIEGVLDIIQKEDFIVVVATNRYAAEMSARAVKVEWYVDEEWTQEKLDQWVTVGNGKKSEVMKKGHAKRLIKKNKANYYKAEYRTPPGSHAQMEPNGAIAYYKDGKVKISAGLQFMPVFQKQVAKLLKISKDDVYIENAFLGGGFGRKSFYQDIAKIALISKLIGKPIHIFGDRTQEFQNGYLRPSTHHIIEVQQADNGEILAMNYQLATDNMFLPYYPKIAETIAGSDPASSHGSRIGYSIKHLNTTYWKTKLPFQVGAWRGVGMFANTFAIESLMDELARKSKIDPIEFRLMHLQDDDELHERQRRMLKKLQVEKIWDKALKNNIGRGMACAEDRRTLVASVVEVSIIKNQIKVERITTVIDPGKIINPEGIRQQVEGAAIMGLSATLMEKIEIKKNAIGSSNFHEYPVPLLTDIPEIKVLLMESGEKPFGVGEPPIAPISAAIANAVFDLTGKRLRNLPLDLNEILAAEQEKKAMLYSE
ncbi:xanthine dehydrogenase family protein molybdopterin-binding subunit, partial [Crocinitomix catalasitica]|nr:xanthine dehydrogenase family protein molybdopterin-binding subunit [Crocinitomix catalasitica]